MSINKLMSIKIDPYLYLNRSKNSSDFVYPLPSLAASAAVRGDACRAAGDVGTLRRPGDEEKTHEVLQPYLIVPGTYFFC